MLRDSEERFSPHFKGDIALDHMARYALAATMIQSTHEVLDVASGEGYGTALLAAVANRVTGMDRSAEAVEHASAKYVRPNLRYLRGNAEQMLDLRDEFFDVVVSFETIEHLQYPNTFLNEVKRVLKPTGFLIISTPDEEVFNEGRAAPNPFHLHEFSRYDFDVTLTDRWKYTRLLGQTTSRYSVIASADGNPVNAFMMGRDREGSVELQGVIPRPMYLIGIASDVGLPGANSLVYG
jgi:SAM-dependent methyltransferase